MFEGSNRRAQRGQTLPLIAFSMVALIGLGSMAVDVGYWRYQQRMEQNAADSAALAGTVQLGYSTSLSSITTAARTDAATNGFTHDGSSVFVTVNSPPLSGSYAGNTSAVEVIVAKKEPVHLAALFGHPTTTVSARAVGLLTSASRNCIYALSTNNAAITINNATINIPKCGIISNGGLLFNQGTVTAASIGYAVAGITINNTVFPAASPKLAITAADPCPTVAGCAYLTANPPTSGSCQAQTTFNSPNTIQVYPGRYCNQVLFEGGGKVVFNPGVYDFEQGFTNNSAPEMDGTGVTFYIKGGNLIIDPPNCILNFTAPTTGNYAGVLVYQPLANGNQFIINSSSQQVNGSWAGMIYVPGGEIIVDGTLSTWLLVVGNSILLNGASGVNDPDSLFPGYGHAVLAE